jgi:hypothetical protein
VRTRHRRADPTCLPQNTVLPPGSQDLTRLGAGFFRKSAWEARRDVKTGE